MQRDTCSEKLSHHAGFKDKAQIIMAEVCSPTQYGYSERLMRAIRKLSCPLYTFICIR
jgi:hypothetical protein